jgi:hypothetical protein
MKSAILGFASIATLLLCVACTNTSGDKASYKDKSSYKDSFKMALQQAELTDVSVAEDSEKNTVTLSGCALARLADPSG